MAGIPVSKLVDEFVDDLERCGATVLRDRSRNTERPARIRVLSERRTDCILFLWTITRGGGGAGVRPVGERRIQITGVSRMPLEPGVRTLLGGWSAEHGVYAFWDARRHISFGSSPSLQVANSTLETAHSVGIATQLRPTVEGHEVVVAVARGSLTWYVENCEQLHNFEANAPDVAELVDASPEDESAYLNSAATEAESVRRSILVTTMRTFRDAKFMPAVLHAYSHKCAVCDCDLKLVEAAHIVPVTHPRSSDEVTNGLALCRLHHGAYDNGLLGVRSDCRIVINPERVDRLRALNLAGSLHDFESRLPERIRIPTSIEVRPLPENLRLGLELRRWPAVLIA